MHVVVKNDYAHHHSQTEHHRLLCGEFATVLPVVIRQNNNRHVGYHISGPFFSTHLTSPGFFHCSDGVGWLREKVSVFVRLAKTSVPINDPNISLPEQVDEHRK